MPVLYECGRDTPAGCVGELDVYWPGCVLFIQACPLCTRKIRPSSIMLRHRASSKQRGRHRKTACRRRHYRTSGWRQNVGSNAAHGTANLGWKTSRRVLLCCTALARRHPYRPLRTPRSRRRRHCSPFRQCTLARTGFGTTGRSAR